MKYFLLTFFLITNISAKSQSNIENEIAALSAKKFEWLKHKQSDSLAHLLDENVQYIHSNAWIENKHELLENNTTGLLIYKNVEVIEAKVRIENNTAILVGKGRFNGIIKANEFDIVLLYTEVYVLKSEYPQT